MTNQRDNSAAKPNEGNGLLYGYLPNGAPMYFNPLAVDGVGVRGQLGRGKSYPNRQPATED